jgi:xylose isomerase
MMRFILQRRRDQMNEKYAVILGNLGNTCDRFLSTGYKTQLPKEEMIRQAAGMERVTGIELVGTWDVTRENHAEVGKLLVDNNLHCVSIIPDLFSQAVWGKGSLSAKDRATRESAIAYMAEMCDIADSLHCSLINIWPGQDGYDYPLQSDFKQERGWMIESIARLAEDHGNLQISLEFKPREPRNHSFFARTADTLLAALETKMPNVGVTIDVGHSLYANENVAESIVLLQQYGKLFHLHLNDNYRYWDDDMIVGSVHFVEYLEMFYWLRETNYAGWYSMDQYPYREDGRAAIEASVKFVQALNRMLSDTAMSELRAIVHNGDAVEANTWVRNAIFGRMA